MDEVQDVLSSGWLGTGPKVTRFEEEFSGYKGGRGHPVALSSCTAALHLSLLVAKLEPGDEVITSPMTFCSTVNAIIHAGATPVLADIDPVTMNIDPAAVTAALTPRTRALVPVHFAGYPCEMDPLLRIARAHDLWVIEDCAHAIETHYRGRPAGTMGDFGCFSFYVTKNVVTGEGGMVIGQNPELAAQVKVLALHGMSKDAWKRFADEGYRHYDVVACGFKYNMMDLQAAIGIHQLERVELAWQRRKDIWEQYQRELVNLPLYLPADVAEVGSRHAYHLFPVLIDEVHSGLSRDAFLAGMTRQRIGVGVHYQSIPEHSYYRTRFGWDPEDFPNARDVGARTVSLPLSPRLSDEDVSDVITAVHSLFRRG